jgi:hypothetical protein
MNTIIYYTANKEDPKFEKKIQDNILKNSGGLPIISISQKPIDFGKNICIGDMGASYLNEWKQILIGLKEAKTDFCIAAESDCLYPPEYFTFTPPVKDKVYRYDNVWIYWTNKPGFYKKDRCEGAQVCGTQYWIERLEEALKFETPREIIKNMFTEEGHWTGSPVVTFKTGKGVSNKSGYFRNTKQKSIPYWDIKEFI